MNRVTTPQLVSAGIVATALHTAVLASMAIHETAMPDPRPQSVVYLDLADVGDPLAELNPQAPMANDVLDLDANVPVVQAAALTEAALPDQPPAPEITTEEATEPDELAEVDPLDPLTEELPDPDVLPETQDLPELEITETPPDDPIEELAPLPDQIEPIEPPRERLVEPETPQPLQVAEATQPEALQETIIPDQLPRPELTDDQLPQPDQVAPPPELTDLAPPPETVDPDTPLERPDLNQETLPTPESVTVPPELAELAPVPEMVEVVPPVETSDQVATLPEPVEPVEAPDEIVAETEPVVRPPEPEVVREQPDQTQIVAEVPKLAPRADEPDLTQSDPMVVAAVLQPQTPQPPELLAEAPKLQPRTDEPVVTPPEPVEIVAVDRPLRPETTPDLPTNLPVPKPRTDPLAELPKPREKPQPQVQVARAETSPAPTPIPQPVAEQPPVQAPAPTTAQETAPPQQVASAPAVVPPEAVISGQAFDEARKAYASSLYLQINNVAVRNYPRKSAQRREEGFVPVRLEVGQAGELLSVTVLDESQASSRLVKAAIKAVEKSAPFPRFAPEMGMEVATFDVRIQYRLR